MVDTYLLDRAGDRAFRRVGPTPQCLPLVRELNASAYAVEEVPFDTFVRFESRTIPVSATQGFDGAFAVVRVASPGERVDNETQPVTHFADSACEDPVTLGEWGAGVMLNWRHKDWCSPNDTPLYVTTDNLGTLRA